jgi:predicted AlkP superfamily phosphohydrolase/phosphomutase
MMTGVNPGKHGVFGFVDFDRSTLRARLTNGGDLRVPTIWQILSANGVRVGALCVPWTYPPAEVNGFVVAGIDAPTLDERAFHPADLYRRARERLGGIPRYFVYSPPCVEPFDLQAVHRQIAAQTDVASWLLDEYRPDVFMLVYGATDYMQHYFWGRSGTRCNVREAPPDLVADTYEQVDAHVGSLLDRHADSDTAVLVVSDHGSRGLRATVNIGLWLQQTNFAVPAGEQRRPPSSLPVRLGRAVLHRVPQLRPLAERYKRRQWHRHLSSLIQGIDWAQSRAVCVSAYGGLVVFGDEAAVERDLREALTGLRDPEDGRPVVGGIARSADLYHGPFAAQAPQLWLQPTDHEYLLMTQWERSPWPVSAAEAAQPNALFLPAFMAGGHSPSGLFLARGGRVAGLDLPNPLHLDDLAPLILGLLGLAPPDYMDGRSFVPRADTSAAVVPDLPGTSAAYSAAEEQVMQERLEGLGYL